MHVIPHSWSHLHILIGVFPPVGLAFIIGFYIYLPFLVIDMVVASTLMSMGMMMLPPTVISLPAKLMLFVLGRRLLHSNSKRKRYEGHGYLVWAAALWAFIIPEMYGVIKGKNGSQNVYLQSRDTIVVP